MGTTNADAALPAALATPARLACLERAQQVRRIRDQLVADLADGQTTIDIVVASDDDDTIASTKVLPLIEAVPHMGKVTSRRLMASLSIDEAAVIADLEPGDRAALLAGIQEHTIDKN